MDIEGAELDALKGAMNILNEFCPKLAIPLYHNITNFLTIPCFISSLNPGYEFGHYTVHSEEAALFAESNMLGHSSLR